MPPLAISRRWMQTAALLAAFGVALGAFGAHGLRDRVAPPLLQAYKTGVLYHLLHAVALLVLGLFPAGGLWRAARILMTFGIVVFSGTLYALALSGRGWLGAITPLGGLAFIAAWATLFVAASRHKDSHNS